MVPFPLARTVREKVLYKLMENMLQPRSLPNCSTIVRFVGAPLLICVSQLALS